MILQGAMDFWNTVPALVAGFLISRFPKSTCLQLYLSLTDLSSPLTILKST